MGVADWNEMLLDASRALDGALEDLNDRSREWADADRRWRLARARSYAEQKGHAGTVDEKAAWVEQETATERYEAQLSEALKVAALEAVRSKRASLSAIQTLVSLNRAEAELSRWGPRAVGDGP